MIIERRKNSVRNIFTGLLNKVVLMVFPIIVRSIMIHLMGSDYLGATNLFSTIIQVLSISELGLATAIVQAMYKPIADDDNSKLCALLNYYKKCYRVIGIVILLAGLIITPFLPHLINGEVPEGINLYFLFFIYLGNTVISYLTFAYRGSLLAAFQREDIISNTDTIMTITKGVLQVVAIAITNNIYIYAVVQPILTIVTNLIRAIVTRKLFPHINPVGVFPKKDRSMLFGKIRGLLLNKVCALTRNTVDNLFISKLFGLKDIALYGNYYYIMFAVDQFLHIINTSITAGVGNSISTETKEKNYRDFLKINSIYMVLTIWCCSFLLCLYQPFIDLVYGNDSLYGIQIPIVFTVYLYSLSLGSIQYVYLNCCGFWDKLKMESIVETILNISLNFAFGILWGIIGIAASTIISVTVGFFWQTKILFNSYFNMSRKQYYWYQIKFLSLFITTVGLSFFVCSMINLSGIVEVVIRTIICIFLPGSIFFILFRKSEGYQYIKSIVRGLLKKGEKNHD